MSDCGLFIQHSVCNWACEGLMLLECGWFEASNWWEIYPGKLWKCQQRTYHVQCMYWWRWRRGLQISRPSVLRYQTSASMKIWALIVAEIQKGSRSCENGSLSSLDGWVSLHMSKMLCSKDWPREYYYGMHKFLTDCGWWCRVLLHSCQCTC